jgi:integrase
LDTKRTYLTEDEVERIIRQAKNERDRLMILMGLRHGFRVSELISLQWRQLNLDLGHVRVRRLKDGAEAIRPIGGREIRALRKLRREQPVGARFVFLTNRGGPMTRNGFYKLPRQPLALELTTPTLIF